MKNRRYLGSKFKLLSFIETVINENCKGCESFMELFGGTGVVSEHFNSRYKIAVNDTLRSNWVVYRAFLSDEIFDKTKVEQIIEKYNEINDSILPDNYYSENFSDTFLSESNMKKLGYIRDDIAAKLDSKEINPKEEAILITSLLYAVDKIANTVGHYDAYRKSGDLDKNLVLLLPHLNDENNKGNRIFNKDANEVAENEYADIVYIDPPYNSRQYCDAYHFLENIALNEKPAVFGVARKMDRNKLKSDYCTTKAPIRFKELIAKIKAKYIIVSYNNTGDKINARSNAKISDDDIIEVLKSKGKVSVYEKSYNAFTTGKTKLSEHSERLFLCEVGVFEPRKGLDKKRQQKPKVSNGDLEIIRSPLNYTGGKAKLIRQIKNFLPQNIETFYDVFSGGLNVAINVTADKVYCVDKNKQLMQLMQFLKDGDYSQLIDDLENKIAEYGLSDSYKNGYKLYGCNSSQGLGGYNKEAFFRLRNDYNEKPNSLLFLLLIIFSFNNQIRFNANQEFNTPVGKRDFNGSLRKKLKLFMDMLKVKNIELLNKDFRELDVQSLRDDKAFLYLDPPYLLGVASYNENGGWTVKDETELLLFLEDCHKADIKFALSNAIRHKDLTHDLLMTWCKDNNFVVNYLEYDYNNANYQTKGRGKETQEVLITNY